MPKPLVLRLLVCVLVAASVQSVSAQDSIVELTNADILTMVRAKLPPELIIAKIQSSRYRLQHFSET